MFLVYLFFSKQWESIPMIINSVACFLSAKSCCQQNSIGNLNPVQNGLFGGCPLLEICHTHPIMRKLFTVTPYLTKFQKINKSCDTFLEFCWHQYFLPEISNFCFIKKYRYRLYFNTKFVTASTLFESLKVVSINMVATLIVTRIDYPRLS